MAGGPYVLLLAGYTSAARTYPVIVSRQAGTVSGEKPRMPLADRVPEIAGRWLGRWLK